MLVKVDKKFISSPERTPRVLEVAEAFGIGLDKREFVVYDKFELDLPQGSVLYITGQSGSGKSLLLREIAKQSAENGLIVADINEMELPEKPLVEIVGKNTQESLEILSRAGLNDAYLFIRKPSELSDGQKYRLKLAMLIDSNADVWVADEFGAILDRTTAKIVCFSMSKLAKTLNKTFVIATTHTDLHEELAPDIRVDKRFREKLEVNGRN